jgi:hypothetical protein
MKTKNVLTGVLIVTSFAVSVSSAGIFEYRGDRTKVDCAPEIQRANVQAADAVLSNLAIGELSSAKEFKALVETTLKMTGPQKMNAYFKMAGIDSDKEIVEFVGAREGETNPKHVEAVMARAGLTKVQSELVLQKLSSALLGQRK